jgi:hypothetical protein
MPKFCQEKSIKYFPVAGLSELPGNSGIKILVIFRVQTRYCLCCIPFSDETVFQNQQYLLSEQYTNAGDPVVKIQRLKK